MDTKLKSYNSKTEHTTSNWYNESTPTEITIKCPMDSLGWGLHLRSGLAKQHKNIIYIV